MIKDQSGSAYGLSQQRLGLWATAFWLASSMQAKAPGGALNSNGLRLCCETTTPVNLPEPVDTRLAQEVEGQSITIQPGNAPTFARWWLSSNQRPDVSRGTTLYGDDVGRTERERPFSEQKSVV